MLGTVGRERSLQGFRGWELVTTSSSASGEGTSFTQTFVLFYVFYLSSMPPCLSLENDTSSGASYLFFPFFRVPLCDHNDGGSIDDVAWHVVRGRLIFDKYTMKCTIGSVVECVIAIHATRVRFSDIACFFFLRTSFYGSCYFLNHFVGNRRA